MSECIFSMYVCMYVYCTTCMLNAGETWYGLEIGMVVTTMWVLGSEPWSPCFYLLSQLSSPLDGLLKLFFKDPILIPSIDTRKALFKIKFGGGEHEPPADQRTTFRSWFSPNIRRFQGLNSGQQA